ncbi:DISARM system helicase DrmA [Herpetosiphon giganteus]|uniref:DISARM system helicase DrmA n=1 Tax=Herpetosiphon giganteus TaxID=2029754 RepID=UPI00195CE761|nr:DISARM system helicase DrmA [Herpetosiphon giganteus]MBM7845674.1 hypothetical protein [Herpetosiphon giganteus]
MAESVLPPPHPFTIRDELESLILRDLLGPAGGEQEEVHEISVRDRYLVGMLAPRKQQILPELHDDLERSALTSDEPPLDVGTTQAPSMFPSSMGLTCSVSPHAETLLVSMTWGKYQRISQETADGNSTRIWQREPRGGSCQLALQPGTHTWQPDPDEPHVQGRAVVRQRAEGWSVSLFLHNMQDEPQRMRDSAWIFQPQIRVTDPAGAPIFRQRMRATLPSDREAQTVAMRYRSVVEFAVGHGVSVQATRDSAQPLWATMLETTVIPSADVPVTTEPSHAEAPELAHLVVDMDTLSRTSMGQFAAALQPLCQAYARWITTQTGRLTTDPSLAPWDDVAADTVRQWQQALTRMQAGIELLDRDPQAAEAFQFANQAMARQRMQSLYAEARRRGQTVTRETFDQPHYRSWRAFQLGFFLLNLPGLTVLTHPDRAASSEALADLLWYPTGGGKTEAYLGLTAYTLAIRRLQGVVAGRSGMDGVAVIMRYTLRLLTLQQFQRASALICACETLRREAAAQGDQRWGTTPFRIGLWVGQRTTPNTTTQSKEVLKTQHRGGYGSFGATGSPAQLTNCPWCGSAIEPGRDISVNEARGRTLIYCGDPRGECPFSRRNANYEGLPVVVVDEEIYRRLPALIIATVDKFAQLPWNGRTQMLFGHVDRYCERHGFGSPELGDESAHRALPNEGLPAVSVRSHGPLRPPDLIIQDELHLLSGPLGTLVGLYETAIDRLCTWTVQQQAVRPKVIASTATVRRADHQVHAVFVRKLAIFPPPGFDANDSFFAMERSISASTPGRRYLGICAIGKRQKAVLIRVYVALLAAAQTLYERYGEAVDPWMTLVGYFNAMRDLGGARRLVDDDIRTRLGKMSQRGLANRRSPRVEELTSRKSAEDIPVLLDALEIPFRTQPTTKQPLDVVLATNMLSVGVDVKRLGAMVVNGQPKTTAEYIQATSRVGRNTPGLVISILNWSRPRDLSHYEQFEHYHATFYQHVEAISVTPFAARALDRGLAAVLVSLIRLYGHTYTENLQAGHIDRENPVVEAMIKVLTERAELVTGQTGVANHVHAEINTRLDDWLNKIHYRHAGVRLGYQGKNDGQTEGLLHMPNADKWGLFTCLNSLRDVEPTTNLLLHDHGFEQDSLRPWAGALGQAEDGA